MTKSSDLFPSLDQSTKENVRFHLPVRIRAFDRPGHNGGSISLYPVKTHIFQVGVILQYSDTMLCLYRATRAV